MEKYKIRMIGDNLIHQQVYQAAWDETSGKYDFNIMFDQIRDSIEEADLSIINQETIFINDPKKYSSFPTFGSPADLGHAIAAAGFDVVLHASNHSLDKGMEGISDTIGFWKKNYPEISFLGVHESADAERRICVKRLGNIKIALLNFTEKMNYRMMPLGKPYVVDRMRKKDKERIRAKIMWARKHADLVVVLPHWGVEYMYEPVSSQKEWARLFAECGADLIIGTHPHVLECTETIITSDERRVPCLYSLGNFISCQIIPGTTLGGMADITISVENGRAVVSDVDIIPLITHTDENYSYFTTYFLSDYTEDMACHNRLLSVMQKRFGGERMTAEKFRALFEDIMNRRASADALFKTPADVRKFNIHGVWSAISGKGSK